MKELKDVGVGDAVVMVYRTGRQTNGKSDDHEVPATVVEAKRVWLTIQAAGNASRRRWRVRRDTGMESNDWPTYGWIARTPDEIAKRKRARIAHEFLLEQGIEVRGSSPWYGRRVELADLLRQFIATDHSLALLDNEMRDRSQPASKLPRVCQLPDCGCSGEAHP